MLWERANFRREEHTGQGGNWRCRVGGKRLWGHCAGAGQARPLRAKRRELAGGGLQRGAAGSENPLWLLHHSTQGLPRLAGSVSTRTESGAEGSEEPLNQIGEEGSGDETALKAHRKRAVPVRQMSS